MANGDTASANGFTPVSASKDIRLGYDDINRLADYVVQRTPAPHAMASGRVTIDLTGSNSVYTGEAVAIPLPVGRFTSTPRIILSPLTQSNEDMVYGTYDISATAFSVHIKRTTNTSTGIDWLAVSNG